MMSTPFRPLALGAVLPRGWMRAQMRRDLDSGFAGRLDRLTPHAAHDLFRDRIGSSDSHLAWWDAETRGNWLWGYVMMAQLADLPEHRARAAALVEALVASRDADGYLGIYGPGERYRHGPGENGELWAQSRALLPLIAHHEATGDEAVLAAVREAVDLTLRAYPEGRPYFQRGDRLGRDLITGLTHGLCYLDVLEWLHERTGEERYATAGLRFYLDFSAMRRPFPNDDLALPNLQDPHQTFAGHAVHTAEHLRALLWASRIAPDRVPAEAVAVALERLRRYRLPSGALIGDESVHGVPLPEAAYEYCTSVELAFSLSSAIQKLGDPGLADWLEVLAFNAVQGARMADGRAIAYLSADTRLRATADRGDSHSFGAPGRRYKYSPTHDDVACCCNPNAVRVLPQIVSRMWLGLNGEPGFAAIVYGPCELRDRVGDVGLRILEETEYPFSDVVQLTIEPDRPVEFTLLLRRPGWDGRVDVSAPDGPVAGRQPVADPDGPVADPGAPATQPKTLFADPNAGIADPNGSVAGRDALDGGWIRLHRTWHPGDRVRLDFTWLNRAQPYANGEVAVLRGPVQYVIPLEHRLTAIRDYPEDGFHDYDVTPVDIAEGYRIPVLDSRTPELGVAFESGEALDPDRPWDRPATVLRAGAARLIPLGCTVLRRAAFPTSPEAKP